MRNSGNWHGRIQNKRGICLKSKSSNRDSAFAQKFCLWRSEAKYPGTNRAREFFGTSYYTYMLFKATQHSSANSNPVKPQNTGLPPPCIWCNISLPGWHCRQVLYTPKKTSERSFRKRICYNHTLHCTDFTTALKPPFLQRCKESQTFKPPFSIRAVSSEKRFAGSWCTPEGARNLVIQHLSNQNQGAFCKTLALFLSLPISVHGDKATFNRQHCSLLQSITQQPEITSLAEHKTVLHQS